MVQECGKCRQEEMLARGEVVGELIPEHSRRCPKRPLNCRECHKPMDPMTLGRAVGWHCPRCGWFRAIELKPEVQRDIPTANVIKLYLHCRRCLGEIPSGISPADYARLEVGWTDLGLQIRCQRHNLNVVHIDFQGQQHPANLAG